MPSRTLDRPYQRRTMQNILYQVFVIKDFIFEYFCTTSVWCRNECRSIKWAHHLFEWFPVESLWLELFHTNSIDGYGIIAVWDSSTSSFNWPPMFTNRLRLRRKNRIFGKINKNHDFITKEKVCFTVAAGLKTISAPFRAYIIQLSGWWRSKHIVTPILPKVVSNTWLPVDPAI